MPAASLGLRLAAERLRVPRGVLGVALAAAIVVVCAWAERRTGGAAAADHALSRVTFGLALPLVACFVLHVACSGRRLQEALDVLAMLGTSRRTAALGLLGGSGALCVALGAVFAAGTVLIARPLTDPVLVDDVLATLWIGALAGLTYAAWFGLGSSFGLGGRGRLWFLVADWLLGAAGSAFLPSPRVYVMGLIAGSSAPDLPLMLCAGLLLTLTLACTLLALWRCTP
jgi:hypothetical protein